MESNVKIDIKGEEIFQIVKDICNFGFRRAGTPPAHKAEMYIYEKLKEVGVDDVKLENVDFTRWWAERHELTIISEETPGVMEDQNIQTFPSWFSVSTPPEGIKAEVAYVRYGTKSDFREIDVKDKIALIEGKMLLNFRPTHNIFNTIEVAEKKGAKAVICINGSPADSITYTNYSNMFQLTSTKIVPSITLPVLSINNHDGEYLKYLCTQYHKTLTVKLVEISKTGPATSNTIIGTLPGKSDDIIVIGTHTDSTFTGAFDNAAANAGLITLAKHYAKLPPEKREKTMIFAGWTGHECESIGSRKFVETHEELLPKITTFIELDGFGCNGYYNQADGGIIDTNLDERRGIFTTDNSVLLSFASDAVMKYKLLPAVSLSAILLEVGDYAPFAKKNVPSLLIIGKSPLYHTELDTIETIRPDQLERSAKAHIEIINKIHSTRAEDIKKSDRKPIDINDFIIKKEGTRKPSAYFHFIPEVLTVGDFAVFVPSVISSPESILLSSEWDLGDGMVSKSIMMIHAYRKPGSYKVRFKVIDNFGNEATQERVLRVVEKFKKK
ncbi:MAG: M28 family peptidase [Promethearchaeota archaeon]